MDKKYWDHKADCYDAEIFSSIHSDTRGVIASEIQKHSSKKKTALDFGCGPGLYLPFLSESFGRVYGYDLSSCLIESAQKRTQGLNNVSLKGADLTKENLKKIRADFCVCANVLIAPDHDLRKKLINNLVTGLKKKAVVVFIIPSSESSLLVNARLFEWNLRDGMNPAEALKESADNETERGNFANGLIPIDNVLTKHYTKEEFEMFAAAAGLKCIKTEKVEYGWQTEFENPPKWMKEPYPWDWMGVFKYKP